MGLNSSLNAEAFRFMAQLGVQDVVLNTPPVPVKDGKWELVDLVGLKNRVDEFGLKLTAIENTQIDMRHHMIAGGPRFEEQLENMLETIKNIGNAGIPVYTMSWRYPRFYRTGHVDVGWGALGTAYDSEIEAWPDRRFHPEIEKHAEVLVRAPPEDPRTEAPNIHPVLCSFAHLCRAVQLISS